MCHDSISNQEKQHIAQVLGSALVDTHLFLFCAINVEDSSRKGLMSHGMSKQPEPSFFKIRPAGGVLESRFGGFDV